jgi:predicted RNA-binding protein (virulence factor B family)
MSMNIGEYSTFTIDRFTSVGAFLQNEEGEEVLLPNKYIEESDEEGKEITVFIYKDSEDRPVATTEIPFVTLDEFAFLIVKDVTPIGAFLDWGLEKDLFVPFKEQQAKMVLGGEYLIRLIKDDKTDRLLGTTKINRYLSDEVNDLEIGDKIELFVGEISDLGREVIINESYKGMIFKDHLVRPLKTGEVTSGYVEFIRQDGKIDVSLVPVGVEKFDHFSQTVLDYLEANNGSMNITDKSHPDLIRQELGLSKKAFKKAVGNLYKKRKIELLDQKIELIK